MNKYESHQIKKEDFENENIEQMLASSNGKKLTVWINPFDKHMHFKVYSTTIPSPNNFIIFYNFDLAMEQYNKF